VALKLFATEAAESSSLSSSSFSSGSHLAEAVLMETAAPETAAPEPAEPAGSDAQAKNVPPARATTQAAVAISFRNPRSSLRVAA
jgi:hypothetical protein